MNLPKKVEDFIKTIHSFAFENDIPIIIDWDSEAETIHISRCNGSVCECSLDCFDYKLLSVKIEEMGFRVTGLSCSTRISVRIVS